MNFKEIKSSILILIYYILGTFILWIIALSIDWLIYYLQGPYDNMNDQLMIFVYLTYTTDVYISLMVVLSLLLTISFYRKKNIPKYRGFLYSFVYSLSVLIIYLFER